METTIRISEGQFGIQLSGIEIVLTPGKIFEDIQRLKPIIKKLIPESLQGEAYPDIDRVYKAIDVIVPLVERFINCFDYHDAFQQELIINDDGTIDMNWDECKLNFKLKDYFQLITEFMEVKSKINEILYPSDSSTDQNEEEAMPPKSWYEEQEEEICKKTTTVSLDKEEEDQGDDEEDFINKEFTAPLKERKQKRHLEHDLTFEKRPTFKTLALALEVDPNSMFDDLLESAHFNKFFLTLRDSYMHQALQAHQIVKICEFYGYNAIIKFTDDLL